jgi:hypothetical protein
MDYAIIWQTTDGRWKVLTNYGNDCAAVCSTEADAVAAAGRFGCRILSTVRLT